MPATPVAVTAGWPSSLGLAVVLGGIAGFMRRDRTPRVLVWIMAGFGGLALGFAGLVVLL